ncbi:MAG: DUF432 domain-containing protein [Desulfurococcales archaeon]|nr:DUF432 domain-containing protein [Desulfurococcales archaeon]
MSRIARSIPWRIGPGDSLVLGEARIERREDGDVTACDRYGCVEARVPPYLDVMAAPAPAIQRLLTATPYIYVEFEKRVYIEEGEDYWTLAPIEIEVYVRDTVLTRLSPAPVKFTLIGDVVDGLLARWFKSTIGYDRDELPDVEGTAIVRFIAKTTGVLVPGVGFNAANASFYAGDDGSIYYSLLTVEVDGNILTAKVSDAPPLNGLREVIYPSKKARLAGLLRLMQPFTMKVEVARKSITTQ